MSGPKLRVAVDGAVVIISPEASTMSIDSTEGPEMPRAASVAQCVLADAAADGGDEAGKRPPERRAQAMFGELRAQRGPGRARAAGHDGVRHVDLDRIERAEIEQRMAARRVEIALRA